MVTDHAMPTMTGSELADQIRRMQPDLPIILVSGYTEQSSNTNSALPRLAKPYRLEDIAVLIMAQSYTMQTCFYIP